MAQLKVRTAQNVILDFQVANIGQRVLGAFIDLVVILLYFYLSNQVYQAVTGGSIFDTVSTAYWRFLLINLPIIIYHPLLEYIWDGKTVGKALLKMRVMRLDGRPAALGDVFLRWLLRVVDVKLGFLFLFFLPRNPANDIEAMFSVLVIIFFTVPFPVVGLLSMSMSKHGQRIGDRVAHTTVVEIKRPFTLDDTILQSTASEYVPRFQNVLQLSDKDIYTIKTTLDQARKTRDYKNVLLLGTKAREILNIQEDIKPLPLLETILKDYNHLAKERDLDTTKV